MAGPVIVRLPRANQDADPAFVVLRVSSTGPNPLDLKVLGTEGTTIFSAELKQNQTSKLRKNKKLGQDEWDNILLSVLLGTDANGNSVNTTNDVEAIADLAPDETSMTITIQNNIEGITQKLGYIKLLDDGADASLYEWCGLSAQNTADLRQEIQASRAQLNEKDAEIKKLQDSLAELAQMKNDNDTQLLQKFSLLLNEKKLKIRDQQRLLQTSNVDSAAVKAMEQTRLAVRARPAGSSRKGKRKADEPAEDDDDTDEGFVKMDVDDANESAHDLDQDQDPDEETADEDTQDEDEVEVDEEKDEEEDDPPIKQSGTRHTGSSQTMAVSNSPEPVAPKPSPAPAKGPPPVAEESDTEDDEL